MLLDLANYPAPGVELWRSALGRSVGRISELVGTEITPVGFLREKYNYLLLSMKIKRIG